MQIVVIHKYPRKRGIEAKFLWPDALAVANQQVSLAGPNLFSNY